MSAQGASGSSRSWNEWTQQLQAYVAWVNSQLRKKPGTKEVSDTVIIKKIKVV